jgi:DNA invertase Pin-like site-specific DNA recombinase
MKIGYARVSSKDQNEARQIDALIASGVDTGHLYVDKASGKDFDRSEYKSLIKAARQGDTIVVTSLDRLGRNYKEIRNEFKKISDKGIFINVLDMPILNTDKVMDNGLTSVFISDLVLTILGYVAEKERENIKTRQKQGIESALKKGKVFGRPLKINNRFTEINKSVVNGEIMVSEACQILSISKKTFYNHRKRILTKLVVD